MQGKQTEELGPTASLLIDIINQRAKVIALPLLALILGFGATYIVDKTYTARASLLPPAQSNAGVSTLASLGALASFAGSSLRAPQEQYASLMMSDTVIDRVIRKFDLQKAYDRDSLTETRIDFRKNVAVSLSKKDSIITVEVDDTVPKRAADVANELIAELKIFVDQLTLNEAKSRRIFFENQLDDTRKQLNAAEKRVQESTISEGSVKIEPRFNAENFGRLQGEISASRTRLEILRQRMIDGAPEIQAERIRLQNLESKLARTNSSAVGESSDYIQRLRDFKYQESIFEFYAKQYESARLDEAKEGPMLQVIDPALPPEKKSRPKRLFVALTAMSVTFFSILLFMLARNSWRRFAQGDAGKAFVERLN